MSRSREYARWIWIELIGFDNELSDFGVAEFLDRTGFVPDVAALLLYNPTFIHSHDSVREDRTFPPDVCCYGGYPASEERERQVWTKVQLQALVAELQGHGAGVYPSVFDRYSAPGPWLAAHPEVLHVSRTRGRMTSICPWKHLSDGSLYEDFFIRKLVEVLRDYGFDGFFGADGYNPPRIPIYDGDFSDDMVGQFAESADNGLPAEFRKPCADNPERIEARADWIWTHRRREWIEFYTGRTASFWRKVASALHAEGKPVYLTSTWTKDPFESICRFGVDYRKLVAAGVDGIVIEAAATALETMVDPDPSSRVLCNFAAAILLNSACLPNTPLLWLHGVKDTNEDWQAIRQAPMALVSEILTFAHLFRTTRDGGLVRCLRGPMVCLADCIRSHEWEWLERHWEMGFASEPGAVLGATLIWSDNMLDRQVDDYIDTQRWTVHRFLHQLLARGAAIHAVVGLERLPEVLGPVVVLAAHLWTRTELDRVLAQSSGPVIVIGAEGMDLPKGSEGFAEDPGGGFTCAVYPRAGGLSPAAFPRSGPDRKVVTETSERPLLFYEELSYVPVSDAFLRRCAALVNACARGGITVEPPGAVSLWAVRLADGCLRLLVRNDRHTSVHARVDAGQPIAAIRFPNSTTGKRILPAGSRFGVTVPARGTALLELTLAPVCPGLPDAVPEHAG